MHSSDNRAASENVQDKGEKKEINRQDKHQIDFSVDPDDFDEIDKGKIDHHSQKVLGGSDDDNDDGGQDKNENGSLITKRHKIRHNEGTVEGGNSDDNSHHRKQTVHNHRRHHHNNDDNDNAAHYSASTPQDEANRILRENEKTINEIDQMAIDAARA